MVCAAVASDDHQNPGANCFFPALPQYWQCRIPRKFVAQDERSPLGTARLSMSRAWVAAAGWSPTPWCGRQRDLAPDRCRVPCRRASRLAPSRAARCARVPKSRATSPGGGGDEGLVPDRSDTKLARAHELHPVPNDGAGREMCYRCRRVRRLCVCGIVRGVVGDAPVRNRLGITILQDRKEALKRPFGSAIVCELALENCTSVWYDTKVPETVPFPEHLTHARGLGVLFPGPGARRLRRGGVGRVEGERSRRKDDEAPDDVDGAAAPTHLIVIDTTWHRARRMYARIPWIRNLPAYVLGETTPLIRSGDASFDERGAPRGGDDASSPANDASSKKTENAEKTDDDGDGDGETVRVESGYRIRKQPKPGFLSTAESVAAALREGEPDGEEAAEGDEASGARRGALAASAVEKCFDAMIDAQVRSFSDRKNVRYRSRKAERAAKEAAAGAGLRQDADETASASAARA